MAMMCVCVCVCVCGALMSIRTIFLGCYGYDVCVCVCVFVCGALMGPIMVCVVVCCGSVSVMV